MKYDAPIGTVIDWYGVYHSLDELVADSYAAEGNRWLYAAVDLSSSTTPQISYAGLTRSPAQRFQRHHKLRNEGCDQFFLGEITSYGKPGRRTGAHAVDLGRAENALIYSFKPRWNDLLKHTRPAGCVSVFSRFWQYDDPDKPIPTPPYFPPLIGFNSWTDEWFPALPEG